MVHLYPIPMANGVAVAVEVHLPKTKLLAVTAGDGYIMCGALDVRLLDERLASRQIVAGRAVGVRTIDDLLSAPLESVTQAAAARGITAGMTGREAIERLLATETARG